MDYKKSKAPVNTVTRNIMDLCDETGNIYESVSIIAKRANQISVQIKEDLSKKLAEGMGLILDVESQPGFGSKFSLYADAYMKKGFEAET